MENIQEQNNQASGSEKPINDASHLPPNPSEVDWSKFDFDRLDYDGYVFPLIADNAQHIENQTTDVDKALAQGKPEKEKDPFVMFDTYVPTIPRPMKKSVRRDYTEAELYLHQGWRLKFKHDRNGEDKFFVSLWGSDITFYFSYKEYYEHWKAHHGEYTHHAFKVFDWALEFYRKRTDKYNHKHTIAELEREYFLFTHPNTANDLAMIL